VPNSNPIRRVRAFKRKREEKQTPRDISSDREIEKKKKKKKKMCVLICKTNLRENRQKLQVIIKTWN